MCSNSIRLVGGARGSRIFRTRPAEASHPRNNRPGCTLHASRAKAPSELAGPNQIESNRPIPHWLPTYAPSAGQALYELVGLANRDTGIPTRHELHH